jgi:hypothetical protein
VQCGKQGAESSDAISLELHIIFFKYLKKMFMYVALFCACSTLIAAWVYNWLTKRTHILDRVDNRVTYMHDDGLYHSHPRLFNPSKDRNDDTYIIKADPPEFTEVARKWNGPSNTELEANIALIPELGELLRNATIYYANNTVRHC